MSDTNDYTLEDLLEENNVDLQNLEKELGTSQDELEDQLKELSKDLKKSFDSLAKALKKEVKSKVINYYHDNKDVVVTDLKVLNSTIHELLDAAKSELSDAISATDDSDERDALKDLRHKVVKFSRKYNHKYHMLRIKLSLGNAELDVKNLFS